MQRPTKEQMRDLPIYAGLTLANIHLVEDEIDAARAINALCNETSLGFDTESKPTFRKGEISAGPTLIQLATLRQAYLFPTRFVSALHAARELLANETIKKIGFGLKADRRELRNKLGIELVNSQDLAIDLRKIIDEKNDVGAKAAVAMVLKQRLQKGAQLSNWGAYPLKKHQLEYAANDAHAAIRVAEKLAT